MPTTINTHLLPGAAIAALTITYTTATGQRITLSAGYLINRRALGV